MLATSKRQVVRATLVSAQQTHRPTPADIHRHDRRVRGLVLQQGRDGPDHDFVGRNKDQAWIRGKDVPRQIEDPSETPGLWQFRDLAYKNTSHSSRRRQPGGHASCLRYSD